MEKLVELTIRIGTGMRIREELLDSLDEEAMKTVEEMAKLLVQEKRGLKYCGLCGKGPFTKKGLYLHLMRVHKDDIKALLEKEMSQAISLTA